MTKVLLTGGNGFVAAHVLEQLLKNGHQVVTSVRSQDKADKIIQAHPKYADSLKTVIVKDLTAEGAFDEVVKTDPPFEAVIHTASPFHFNFEDVEKEMLDPAIIGTTGILKSIHKNAPSVKRVVITSSFAAIIDPDKGNAPGKVYSEEDWSPLTRERAHESKSYGYRASKTLAEQAAWTFVKENSPNFSIATINPPLIFGPIVHYLNSLDALNTSNQRFRDLIQGKNREGEIPDTGTYAWVSVLDVAEAHVKAAELEEAGGKRFYVTSADKFSNKEIADIIRKNFPEYKDELPREDAAGGDYPKEGIYSSDNSRSREVLGLKYRSLEETVVETVKSLKNVGA